MTMDSDDGQQDVNICRICRSEGTHDRPLFYPCLCHGSIKYIHQECLVQWLRYSKKDICELCNHKFTFLPIYSPDCPKRLPIKDIVSGLATSVITALRYWIHYSLVGFSWLGIVPLSACRIHRSLFSGSLNSLLTLPLDLLSTDNILADIFHGCIVVACTLSIFISLIWLREHLQHGNAPPWLEGPQELFNDPQPQQEGENPEVQPPEENNQEGGIVEENAGPGIENVEGGNNIADPANENNNQRVAENNANNDDLGNWNPMEWDRAAEELTWERLLGLDGSLVFLEHVFWVVSLNTLFILVFEFVPYHIGHASLLILKLENFTKSHFEGLLTTIIGYIIIGISLVFLHFFASLLCLKKSKKIVGVCYVIVKVCILSCVEIGIFPLICGWWLDICSLSLFDATLKDREASFTKAPGTSFFMHWLFGMIYVFYFASFVLLLREVLRPGVLWFLRNLNDPDFNPIQEMIHLTIFRHIRRFLFSIIIFGTTVLLMVWLPVRMIKRFWPSFLPFTFVFTTEQTHELSLELILLQVIMPALLEQGHSREWLKKIIRVWCIFISWVLDLKNYLLAENDNNENNVAENENEPQADENNPVVNPVPVENPIPEEVNEHHEQEVIVQQPLPQEPLQQQVQQQQPIVEEPVGLGFGLGALGQAHQQLLLRDGPAGFKSYIRPDYFPLKIAILIMAMCLSLTFVSILIITVPVTLGRYLMALWITKSEEPIHELYTTFTGLYVSLLLIRLLVILINWIPRGWANFANTVKRWSITVLKAIIVLTLLVAVIPYLSGLLVELLVITPLRVPINQTPLYSASENWIMGTLYVKIVCAIAMMSPQNFWLRRCLERIYQDGLRNIRLNFILKDLAAPFIFALGFTLSLPYVISHSIVPIFVSNFETQNLVKRRIYPYFLIVICFGLILYFQMSQFKKLLQSIKNDKYLVGRRLVNYERPPPAPTPAPIVQQPQHQPGIPAEE